ncbi:MAG: DegT/DnrJ/EryC1/StrS family aminotransferase [Pseudodesulfovibrio sp.]|uniref:DegT/DnrJ/EryC1/StrS aminotransferase n=1 Tax=Pseudodesulfovibrio aespoeensis (strain ATCC 700646 / DSM 10631 / Aspo-2) TaxID=643562 RepID=E6VZA2_PSEA9|nr:MULTISPECIES: DegT/DnrJ/EryC1/StrS family aminotransferase [Pseudodesulfovibrio]MBU4192314.1 DegT/DnrJ/EryC1/StrS family aminotransferase [Pseudomonadota bacterium]ADU63974.1 DegT/DnrJ/EryC1/StrS aminotransferase [Pseudodesulfovibrio aespoeensis Aspo-2]MBU4244003.1 DegT/DnrJ/EryC1/StrS family aminotransferase [Pseudomonadota bacterium]MBU4379254.1 DegT/DnrJ/EryC1/StrS family aminotransferase [Pseudomonadota bacterium]MBU4474357.1 DegT/DnrJ/EryC1/StrS family aminotransferase [Pseudomonadota 
MSIPFIDLKTQYQQVEASVRAGIDRVLGHGAYIMGPEIAELEERLSSFCAVRHAVGCASGTDALVMALMAFEVGPGDAVFTTPFTFMATAEAIALLGATPVFVDIDPVTFNIDPDELRRKIGEVKDTRKDLIPKGVIAVDLFGQPADYARIEPVAHNNGLFLIVDAAQSFGATYKGKPVCSLGDVACTSFFPAKPLGCYGDGGMLFAHNDAMHKLLVSIRVHGMGEDKYENVRLGINGRLDSIQAAVLLAKFAIFPGEIEKRQQVADRYAALLDDIDGLTVPTVSEGNTSVWAQYSVLARDAAHKDALMGRLRAADIPTAIYYPKPLHLQKAFAGLKYGKGDFPVSENVAGRIFSLPMHPYLSGQDQEAVAAAMKG